MKEHFWVTAQPKEERVTIDDFQVNFADPGGKGDYLEIVSALPKRFQQYHDFQVKLCSGCPDCKGIIGETGITEEDLRD